MSKQTAIKIHVEVGPDHTIRLPDEVPEGPAELIVLVEPAGQGTAAQKSMLGLFADEPEIVDEMMNHVRDARARMRLRPIG